MTLRRYIAHTLATCALSATFMLSSAVHAATFDLSTATVADIQAAMDSGALTSEKLVQLYLARIDAYDKKGPKLNSVLTLNKNALEEARALDAERKAKGPRSPLHGIVVLPKDVYDTYDMPTTGGFKPMATSQPSRDAFVIDRLRDAGAVILGKLNQSDWYGVAPSGGSTLASCASAMAFAISICFQKTFSFLNCSIRAFNVCVASTVGMPVGS